MAIKPEAENDEEGLLVNCPKRPSGKLLPSAEKDIAHDQWDRVYGILPFDYEVYVLLDGNKPGEYIFGPFKFNHEPFYVGQGKKGERHINSKKLGRQSEQFTEKIKRIRSIVGIGGSLGSIRHQIINEFFTQNKAKMVEKKMIRLIGHRYLTNATYTLVIEPLLDEDFERHPANSLLM